MPNNPISTRFGSIDTDNPNHRDSINPILALEQASILELQTIEHGGTNRSANEE